MIRLLAIDGSTKKLSMVSRDWTANDAPWCLFEVPLNADSFVKDNSVKEVFKRALLTETEVIAYEKPFMNKNVKVYGQLMTVMARVEGVARNLGFNWIGLTPGEWQVMIRQRGEGAIKRAEVKLRSAMLAKEILGFTPGTEDLCDAACIYDYMQRTVKGSV